MSEWYYADAQRERHGPIDADAIRSKFNQGELNLTTLVWREGLSQWEPLSSVVDELQLLTQANPNPVINLSKDTPAEQTDHNEAIGSELPAAESVLPAPPATDSSYSPYTAPSSNPQELPANVVQGGVVVQAGFWKRVAAYFIDYMVMLVVNYAVMIPMGLVVAVIGGNGSSGAGSAVAMMVMGVGYLLILAVNIMYPAWMHSSRYQATLGKMAVGIKVVRTDGQRISLARGVGRIFATMLSSLILGIGFLMAAFTDRKQALHDMVCDTLVVDKWAFTEHPERQQPTLGVVTIVILSLFGLMLVVGLVAMVALIGVMAKLS